MANVRRVPAECTVPGSQFRLAWRWTGNNDRSREGRTGLNRGQHHIQTKAEQSWRLLTAALLVVTLFAQSLLPFFYAAEARASQIEGKAQTFMVCTAEGYKLIRSGDATDPGESGQVLHCPLCLGAQQLAILPPPSPNALPALSETVLRRRPAPDAGRPAGIMLRWPEARAPPAIV